MLVSTYSAAKITRNCILAHNGDVPATIQSALHAIAIDLHESVLALKEGRKTIPIIVSVGMEIERKT